MGRRCWNSPARGLHYQGVKAMSNATKSRIGSEINKKGDASRFAKPEPGKFTLRT
jgi:hypothetical protein